MMKKIILVLLLTSASLFATASQAYISPSFLKKKMVIIDIRTKGEWIQTGILKGSITETFFDEKGRYDIRKFIDVVKANVDVKKGETFALICATGSRSNMLASFLGQNGFNVIDLTNGILGAQQQRMQLVPYK
jgi:rhodanese-related sulfurtransferase